jgi:hypothetical protein
VINPLLCSARDFGGVYLLAWSRYPPASMRPSDRAVKCVGESYSFLARMDQFRTSAGFLGARDDGHSAGWRWPLNKTEHLWAAFFEIGTNLLPHLAKGYRKWMEAVALEEYRQVQGDLPIVNRAKEKELVFESFKR